MESNKPSEILPTDGGIWVCHTCKTVIGPIVDDDKNKCGCDVYDFEYSRYIPDTRPTILEAGEFKALMKVEVVAKYPYQAIEAIKQLDSKLTAVTSERDEANELLKSYIEEDKCACTYTGYTCRHCLTKAHLSSLDQQGKE